jgi:hypothetical protein
MMSAKRDNSESDINKTPEKKKCKLANVYQRKFRKDWLDDERFSAWIEGSKGDENKANCMHCNCELAGGITQVERHGNTEKHKKICIVLTCAQK